MKLSTKGRYGLKAMFELSMHYGEGPVALKNIAENQKLSEYYLEQLFATLRKARLVTSVRGAQGGYMLASDPKNITVGDIIRVLEGPMVPSDCVIKEEPAACERAEYCVTKVVWEKIRDSFNDVVDSITLGDMLDDHRKIKDKKNHIF